MSAAPTVSFEFFPPISEIGNIDLLNTVGRLIPLRPQFITVTYGAAGSSRHRTRDCAVLLHRDTHLSVAPHLTCIDSSCEEITTTARDYWQLGVRHVVALRGDAPAAPPVPTEPRFRSAVRTEPGFRYASELVHQLKTLAPFEITVAAYPEGHPESGLSVEADLDNLARKVDAGASRAITQFCFDSDAVLRYRDQCAARGLNLPIVPGILPITRFSQLVRFAKRCGASIPQWLAQRFEGLDTEPETLRMLAAHVAIEQTQYLRKRGVDHFHFYTLNRPELTLAACHALGLRPAFGPTAEVA